MYQLALEMFATCYLSRQDTAKADWLRFLDKMAVQCWNSYWPICPQIKLFPYFLFLVIRGQFFFWQYQFINCCFVETKNDLAYQTKTTRTVPFSITVAQTCMDLSDIEYNPAEE